MSRSQEDVLEQVARGQLSADQANTLLASMPPERGRFRALVHPFESITTQQALLSTGAAAGLSFLCGTWGVHFDGALDLHVSSHAVPLVTRVVELGVAFLLPALIFWLGARLFAKQGRFLDFFVAVGVARVPYVLSAPLLLAIGKPEADGPAAVMAYMAAHPARMALTALLGLCALAWLITLLYTGVKTAAGIAGKKLTVAFVVSLLLAEALSKLVLFALLA